MLYAKFVVFNAGTVNEQNTMSKYRFFINGVYHVSNVYVGSDHSTITLDGYGEVEFNSVFFEFFDEYENAVDIYSNPVYQQNYCIKNNITTVLNPSIRIYTKPQKRGLFKRIFR